MEIIIALIIIVVLIGIPTWLVLKAVKKALANHQYCVIDPYIGFVYHNQVNPSLERC